MATDVAQKEAETSLKFPIQLWNLPINFRCVTLDLMLNIRKYDGLAYQSANNLINLMKSLKFPIYFTFTIFLCCTCFFSIALKSFAFLSNTLTKLIERIGKKFELRFRFRLSSKRVLSVTAEPSSGVGIFVISRKRPPLLMPRRLGLYRSRIRKGDPFCADSPYENSATTVGKRCLSQ